MSKHNCQVTVPRWALFPKTSLLQILPFINIVKKNPVGNPLSNVLASCCMSVSLLQNTSVFCSQMISVPFTFTRVLLFAQSAILGTAQDECVTDTSSFTSNYKLYRTISTGHKALLPVSSLRYKNQLDQLCPVTAPKGQPCQSDTVPASTKHQLLQLPQPYPRCHLYTTAPFLCGFLKRQTGCTAQASQNPDIHLFGGRRHRCLFPRPVLEAVAAERAGGEGSHVARGAGETGAAPHSCHLGIKA